MGKTNNKMRATELDKELQEVFDNDSCLTLDQQPVSMEDDLAFGEEIITGNSNSDNDVEFIDTPPNIASGATPEDNMPSFDSYNDTFDGFAEPDEEEFNCESEDFLNCDVIRDIEILKTIRSLASQFKYLDTAEQKENILMDIMHLSVQVGAR